jgi:penicillin-binding protein activator
MKALGLLVASLFVLAHLGCGPQAFVKGEYDNNVERNNLLNDQWSETDMQVVARDLVASLTATPSIAGATKRPVVMVTRLQNKTSEHIETQSIVKRVKMLPPNTSIKIRA